MVDNITEELMRTLKEGNPLPNHENMEFVSTKEVLEDLNMRIAHTPDLEKIEHTIQKEREKSTKQNSIFDETALRTTLMETCFLSRNKFAMEANINPSHLTQFLNGSKPGNKEKGMSRDRLLCIFITLKMDIPEINSYLKKFNGVDTLHARIKRDYFIMMGIEQKLTLDKIDQMLKNNKMEGLENFND